MKPKKIQLISQVSTDKWYRSVGGDIFRFVHDPNPGWLRGNVRVYRESIYDYGGGTKTWAAIDYLIAGTGSLMLRRHGDDFEISAFKITEVDVERYQDALIEDLRKAEYALQQKKAKVADILNKLNSKSVV